MIPYMESLSSHIDFYIYEPTSEAGKSMTTAVPTLTPWALILTKLGQGLERPSKTRLQLAAFFLEHAWKSGYFSFKKTQDGLYSDRMTSVATTSSLWTKEVERHTDITYSRPQAWILTRIPTPEAMKNSPIFFPPWTSTSVPILRRN